MEDEEMLEEGSEEGDSDEPSEEREDDDDDMIASLMSPMHKDALRSLLMVVASLGAKTKNGT